MGHVFWFPSGQQSCFAWFWVLTWYNSGSFPVYVCKTEWIPASSTMGRLTPHIMGWHSFPFWPSGTFSVHMYIGRAPWPWKWEICGLFISYLGRTQFLFVLAIIFILEALSTGDRFQLLGLGPIYFLPEDDPEEKPRPALMEYFWGSKPCLSIDGMLRMV